MAAGQPTLYNRAYCALVVEWGAQGKSITWMAAQFNVARDTIYAWEAANPEFSDALDRARAKCQAWWEDQGQTGLTAPMFNGGVWAKNMGSRFKADWSEKSTVEVSGVNGGPIQHMTLEFVDASPVPGKT